MTREIIDGVVRLTADADKWLTNDETNSKQVYIGKNCLESDWREVDDPVDFEKSAAENKAEAYDILTGVTE